MTEENNERKEAAIKLLDEAKKLYDNGNFDEAIACLSKINEKDDQKVYAIAQLNSGLICYKKGNEQDAINYWENVLNEHDKGAFAQAQYNLGVVYYENRDNEQAEEYWLKVLHDDDKEMYANAQFSLGVICHENGDIGQAEKRWENVQRDDNKNLYALAQYNLGAIFDEKGDKEKALDCWVNIEIDDDPYWYNEAQFQLGKFYIKAGKQSEVIKYWGNVKYYHINDWRVVIQLDYLRIFFSNNDKNIIEIIKLIFSIQGEVDKIVHSVVLKPFLDKGYKKQPERKVAHYTNVGVIENLISNENTSFWLNMYNNMNDMTEGKALFDFIGLDEKKKDEDFFAFLTCFTFNHNSLNQFRLYGKIDNIEGSGVSFVVNNNMFSDKHIDDDVISFTDLFKKSISINDTNIVSKDEDNTSSPAEDNNSIAVKQKLPLYRCIYINPVNGYVSVSKRNKYSFYLENENPENEFTEYEKEIQIIEQKVKASLIEIQKKYQDIINSGIKDELKQSVDSLVEKILLLLRFLIKHASFEEEAECRILYIKSLYDEMVKCEGDRIFIPYNIPAVGRNGEETYLKKLYLGPKVKSSVEMKLKHLYHAQSKQVLNVEVSDLPLA